MSKPFRVTFGLCLATFLISSLPSTLFAFNATEDLPNQVQVSEGIFRGGRPTLAGLQTLQKAGIRTVINLENDQQAVQKEEANLRQSGIQFISIPLASWRTPKDADVEKILDLLADAKNFPIYLHCKHGEDRTGLMIGLFRVFQQDWTPSEAYKEMQYLGFHRLLFVLDRFYKRQTNFDD